MNCSRNSHCMWNLWDSSSIQWGCPLLFGRRFNFKLSTLPNDKSCSKYICHCKYVCNCYIFLPLQCTKYILDIYVTGIVCTRYICQYATVCTKYIFLSEHLFLQNFPGGASQPDHFYHSRTTSTLFPPGLTTCAKFGRLVRAMYSMARAHISCYDATSLAACSAAYRVRTRQ